MTGKIFGIPLALILLSLFIALLVDVPMYFLYTKQVKQIDELHTITVETQETVKQKITPVIEEREVIVPTVTPTPKKSSPTPTESTQE